MTLVPPVPLELPLPRDGSRPLDDSALRAEVEARWRDHPSPAVRAHVSTWDETSRVAVGLAAFTDHRTQAIARICASTPAAVLGLLRTRLTELRALG